MSLVRRWVWLAGMLGTALGLVAASISSADDLRRVRVRIVADQPEVRISDTRGRTVRVVATSDGLVVDGKTGGARFEARDQGPYKVKLRQGPALHVRGNLRVETSTSGLLVINEVKLEDYVAGTIGAEMYSFWEAAALRAQAVACRSYVLYQMEEMEDQPYDVTGDVLSQRYLGVRGESDAAWAALRATTGEIISYAGRPALAAFHSASGGQTASSQEVWGTSLPYLRSLPVADEDDSPDTYWRVTISDAHIEGGLAQLGYEIGSLVDVVVLQRTISADESTPALHSPDPDAQDRVLLALQLGQELQAQVGGRLVAHHVRQRRAGKHNVRNRHPHARPCVAYQSCNPVPRGVSWDGGPRRHHPNAVLVVPGQHRWGPKRAASHKCRRRRPRGGYR